MVEKEKKSDISKKVLFYSYFFHERRPFGRKVYCQQLITRVVFQDLDLQSKYEKLKNEDEVLKNKVSSGGLLLIVIINWKYVHAEK